MGISPRLINIYPEKGLSGNTTFRAYYTLSSIKLLQG